MMLVGLGLKVWADNIRGFFAFPGFLSSIISFSRLAALALATAWVSFTINFLAGLVASIHGVAVIPAIILIIAGHLFNFAFNAFGAFIHALRLHYVEFMGLFFTAKGKPFTPLGE
jgi:V/A-type H+-transporting ATPase subunit I